MWMPRNPGCNPVLVTLWFVSPASGLQLFTIINFPPFARTSRQFSKTLIISSSVKITNKFLTIIASTSFDCGASLRISPAINVTLRSGIPSLARNFLARSTTSGKSSRAPWGMFTSGQFKKSRQKVSLSSPDIHDPVALVPGVHSKHAWLRTV